MPKLRNYLQMLGLRGKPRRYGHRVEQFQVEGFAEPIHFAQWLHPSDRPKRVEAALVRTYEQFIRKGDLCIDIGAYTGDSVLPVALAAGPDGMVIALEPNPYVFPVLEKNARLNRGLTRIQPIMAAAGSKDGLMTFEYTDEGYCNGGRHEGIPRVRHGHAFDLEVVTIDLARELEQCFAAELPRLRYIKVDAEGYDLSVLKALAEIIRKYRPFLKAEVFTKSSREYRQELVGFLSGFGYEIRKMDDDADLKGPLVGPDDVMKWKHYDIFCVPKPNAG